MTPNILNYVESNMKTFDEAALNEVDALVFSWLSYYHIDEKVFKKKSFGNIKIKELYNAKYFDGMLFGVSDIESSKKLLSLVAASPRFRDIDILYYDEHSSKSLEKQFSAMTFRIGVEKYLVAFRGTDHSFVGWKEDLNMSFMKHIPSQIAAKEYLEKVVSKYKGTYYIAGHSKGGNLAVYASSFINDSLKKFIVNIYNFDGPNLNSKLTEDARYKDTKIKIKKYVPQSSVVGMCFEKTLKYKIVKSNSLGMLQHNPFTWEVTGNKLKILKNTTFNSKIFKNGINALIDNLSDKELKLFANSIYEVVNATKVDTVEDFVKHINNTFPIVINEINSFNAEQKNLAKRIFDIYSKEVIKSFIPD